MLDIAVIVKIMVGPVISACETGKCRCKIELHFASVTSSPVVVEEDFFFFADP